MKDVVDVVLNYIYSIAHAIGTGIFKLVHNIFPGAEIPSNIVDAVGFLAVLTIILIIAQAAKKIAWIIVAVGWILILIKIITIVI